MNAFENLEFGADVIFALKTADKGQVLTNNIDYTRPLNEYPKSEAIANRLMSKGNLRNHVYTKDLNVNGVAIQDSIEKYLETDALQSSHLKQALITPLHFSFSLGSEREELEKASAKKPHFELGRYLHECILEPTKFSRVIVEDKYSLTSNEGVSKGIAFWERTINALEVVCWEGAEIKPQEAFSLCMGKIEESGLSLDKLDGKKTYLKLLKELSGLACVSEEHYLKIQILKKHYDNYGGGVLKDLLLHSKREISFYAEHQDGLKLKCRPDAIQFSENIGVNAIISIKSTACEDLQAFYHNAAKLNYDLTEGMYQEVVSEVTGRDFNTTIMVMLQTVAPFGIAVLVWSADDIEMGKYKFRTGLQIAKECKEKGIYQGYEVFAQDSTLGLIDMELPSWNRKTLAPTTMGLNSIV